MKTTNYSALVFDLGGVIFSIDRDRCVMNLEALGMAEAASLLDLYCQTGDFLELEEGKISAGEFYDRWRAMATPGTSDEQITQALYSFITALPPHRLDALKELRARGFKLYVLSNTNPILYHGVIDRLFRQRGESIRDYFDGEILSFQEKVCKPDPEIFRILLRRYALDPEHTLFLDDSAKNCEASRAEGIPSLLIPENAEFIDILRENGILD